MGLVTIVSGLAVPIGILIGAGALQGEGKAVVIFTYVMWVVNPVGIWLLQFFDGIFTSIASYILGTMVSAYGWGMIDASIPALKSRRD